METFPALLALATLLCSLVAGFLFGFSTVVMPGIRSLSDRQFIRAFQVIDRVIQNNQPVFLFVWPGSVVALIASAVLGYGQLDQSGRVALVGVSLAYILGVQVPTIVINVPLNNRLQAVDTESLNEAELEDARAGFEGPWNRWNVIRTIFASLASFALILLVYKL